VSASGDVCVDGGLRRVAVSVTGACGHGASVCLEMAHALQLARGRFLGFGFEAWLVLECGVECGVEKTCEG